jgi:hypothetical protein
MALHKDVLGVKCPLTHQRLEQRRMHSTVETGSGPKKKSRQNLAVGGQNPSPSLHTPVPVQVPETW